MTNWSNLSDAAPSEALDAHGNLHSLIAAIPFVSKRPSELRSLGFVLVSDSQEWVDATLCVFIPLATCGWVLIRRRHPVYCTSAPSVATFRHCPAAHMHTELIRILPLTISSFSGIRVSAADFRRLVTVSMFPPSTVCSLFARNSNPLSVCRATFYPRVPAGGNCSVSTVDISSGSWRLGPEDMSLF